MRRVSGWICLSAVLVTPAAAHDFWIEPSTFGPQRGETVAVRLRIGDGFGGDPFPRDPTHLERFVVDEGHGPREVSGRPGQDPAGTFRAAATGSVLIGYASRPRLIELDPATFERYLRERGLDAALAARERRGERDQPGRELYSRHAKAMLGQVEQPLGLRLEIVPVGDGGRSFEVRFDGAPLPGVLVQATPRSTPHAMRSERTDAYGRVALDLDRPGAWLLAAVHMIPAPAGSRADWRSFWSTLTFERRERVPTGVARDVAIGQACR